MVVEIRIVLLLVEDLGISATTSRHTANMEVELADGEIGWEWVIVVWMDGLVLVYTTCTICCNCCINDEVFILDWG